MKKNKIIMFDIVQDKTNEYYNALIEMQSSNFYVLEDDLNNSKTNEKSKAKKLTKTYIRGRLNK